MRDEADFLYSTTDVTIESTVETDIGTNRGGWHPVRRLVMTKSNEKML